MEQQHDNTRTVRLAGELSETIPDRIDRADLRTDLAVSEPPAYFALYDLSGYDDEDIEECREKGLWRTVDADNVIAWGLEFTGYAVSVLPNLYTGDVELRMHPDAEAAHRFFSTRAPLELSYLPLPEPARG